MGRLYVTEKCQAAKLKEVAGPWRKLLKWYRGADKSLARPTSRCILFDGENISLVANK